MPQIEVRVAKGMDIARVAQPLTRGDSPRRVLARVMHQQDREVELPLQLTMKPRPARYANFSTTRNKPKLCRFRGDLLRGGMTTRPLKGPRRENSISAFVGCHSDLAPFRAVETYGRSNAFARGGVCSKLPSDPFGRTSGTVVGIKG